MSGALSTIPSPATTPLSGVKPPPTNQGVNPNSFGPQQTTGSNAFDYTNLTKDQEQELIRVAGVNINALRSQYQLDAVFKEIDRNYMAENDYTEEQLKARLANRTGNAHKMQDVTVPIVMPHVQAAMSYYVETFLTGFPIFGVSADPGNEDAALAMQTLIGEQAVTANWARQMMLFFRDGLKYNLHALECEWVERKTASVANSSSSPGATDTKPIIWKGNWLKRMDLYNTFWDPRVHPSEVHTEGEFVGYTELYSKVRFKKFMNSLYNKVSPATAMRALQSSAIQTSTSNYGATPWGFSTPIINPFPTLLTSSQGPDWLSWANNTTTGDGKISYANCYNVTKYYARIIPSDYGIKVPGPNTPQVWKFIVVNGSVIVVAERMSNAHDFLPIVFGQPLEDGLDYQTKSYAGNVVEMQQIASAMMNGYMASKRRLVGDRVLYDPLRVSEKMINSKEPAAKIPVRPAAYGKEVASAVYQFPYRDEAVQTLLQGSQQITQYAEKISGINPAQQGQFVKGNKTQHEYDDVMGHGNAQFHMMALATEGQVFTPIKAIILLNNLQYQDATTVTSSNSGQAAQYDPTAMRNAALKMNVSDGLMPTDKEVDADALQTAIQVIGSSPQIGSGYNLAPLFSYMMKTQGLDLSSFEKDPGQVQYEQQMQAWQQAAAMAAQKGTPFSSPMPQPPPPPGTANNPTGQAPATPPAQAQQQVPPSAQPGPGQQQPAPNQIPRAPAAGSKH